MNWVVVLKQTHKKTLRHGKLFCITGPGYRWIILAKGQQCRVLIFMWTNCWTCSRIAPDLGHHDVHMTSLEGSNWPQHNDINCFREYMQENWIFVDTLNLNYKQMCFIIHGSAIMITCLIITLKYRSYINMGTICHYCAHICPWT